MKKIKVYYINKERKSLSAQKQDSALRILGNWA